MYDVIVIGNDICSLTAAARAAQIGLKTALISDKSLPDRFEFSGYSFELDPLPWPFIDFSNYPFLSGFNSARLQDAPESTMQVILPDHRIDIVSGKYSQIRELTRELPEYETEINKLFKLVDEIHPIFGRLLSALFHGGKSIGDFVRLIPDLFLKQILWSVQVKKVHASAALKDILNLQVGALSYRAQPKDLTKADSAYVISVPWNGTSLYCGDKGRIRNEIRKSLLDSGGDLINGDSIQKLHLNKEIDVVIGDFKDETMISGRNVIISTKSRLLKSKRDSAIVKWLLRKEKKRGPVFYPFTLHLGISEQAVPEMMKDYVFLVPECNSSLEACNMIMLNFPGAVCAPEGRRALTATVFLPDSPADIEDDKLKSIGETVLNDLEAFLPFLKENIDFLDFDTSIEISRKSLDVVGPKLSSSAGLFRMLMFPDNRPKKNVFLAGGELYPEFGFIGEILSGILAVNRISGGKSNGSKQIQFRNNKPG